MKHFWWSVLSCILNTYGLLHFCCFCLLNIHGRTTTSPHDTRSSATTCARDRMSVRLRMCRTAWARDYVCARPAWARGLRVRATARARDYVCARLPERTTTYAREFLSARRRMRVNSWARDDVYSRRRVSLSTRVHAYVGANLEWDMSATYARVTPSLPCGNPNASRTDKRPVQLTRTDGHVDNPAVILGCTYQTHFISVIR